MRLVYTVELVHRLFPVVRYGGIEVVGSLVHGKLRVYLVAARAEEPLAHGHKAEVAVVNECRRYIPACGGKEAVLVFHRLQSCHWHTHSYALATGETPLGKEVTEIIVVLYLRLAELLHRGQSALIPCVQPVRHIGQVCPLPLRLAARYGLHVHCRAVSVEHLYLLAVEPWQQSVLLYLVRYLIAQRVVPASHANVVPLHREPVVFVQHGRTLPRHGEHRVVEQLATLAHLEGDDAGIADVVAHTSVDFYSVCHNQFIL